MNRATRYKKKKWPWVLSIFGLLIVSALIYLIILYVNFTNTMKDTYEPIDRDISDKRDEPIELENQEPFSVLVLGVDETEYDAGRSDTMIVLAVNPKTNSTKMVSIPRDTYTDIIGRDFKDKLNHAYAFGGNKMVIDSVENLLDIPIDYYVQVNMESFQEIVDAVGGIDVQNEFEFEFEQNGKRFNKGNIHLKGDEALAFVRMRYEDPRGDFGRQDRQKIVVQAVLKKGASINSLFNYKDIFNSISDNVRTNMSFDEMVDVQKNYRKAASSIDQLYIQNGHGKRMNGIWYYIMDEEELNQITTELKNQLEV